MTGKTNIIKSTKIGRSWNDITYIPTVPGRYYVVSSVYTGIVSTMIGGTSISETAYGPTRSIANCAEKIYRANGSTLYTTSGYGVGCIELLVE